MKLIWSHGIATVSPLPGARQLKDYYERFHQNLSENWNQERERRRLMAIERFKSSGRLLDVGAGRGFFVKTVSGQAGWQALGQELSVTAAAWAKKHLGLKLLAGELTRLKFKDNAFDVITLHSVLEHTRRPLQVLRFCYRKLAPGGVLVFSVPNRNSYEYFLSRWLRQPYQGYIFEHLHYFTASGVRWLVERFGGEILSLTSRHYSAPEAWRKHPYWLMIKLLKIFFEYTGPGGRFCLGGTIYAYVKKPAA